MIDRQLEFAVCIKIPGEIGRASSDSGLCILSSYSSSLSISFFLSSSYFSHPWSMHSLPCLNLQRSTFVGLSEIISHEAGIELVCA